MMNKPACKVMAILTFGNLLFSAQAGSVGLDSMSYDGSSGQVAVTVVYDFTDSNIAGGGLDLIYDASALIFVSYEPAPLPPDAWAPGSPTGSLETPGLYSGFGIGANKLQQVFGGITTAGPIGTFVFDVLGATDSNATPCGMTLCLQQTVFNPWIDVYEGNVGEALLANGTSGADVLAPVPIPAALYLLLSSLCGLLGFGHSSNRDNERTIPAR